MAFLGCDLTLEDTTDELIMDYYLVLRDYRMSYHNSFLLILTS